MGNLAEALPAGLSGTASGTARGAFRREDARRMNETGRVGVTSLETERSSPGDDPDLPLLLRVAQGDERAYSVLVDRHLGRIFGLARRVLGNEHDAEDVAQEAFLKVWRHADAWEPGRARFETWLYRVALNLCYDRLRRRREVTVEEFPDTADDAPSVIEVHAGRDIAREVEAALARLPERQRMAVLLCHYQELSNAEAADLLDISVDALESLLARARRALRSLLADRVSNLLEGA